MNCDDALPCEIEVPEGMSEDAAALYRLLAFAALAAGDQKLTETKQLIEAAMLSLVDSRQRDRADHAVARRPPGHLH